MLLQKGMRGNFPSRKCYVSSNAMKVLWPECTLSDAKNRNNVKFRNTADQGGLCLTPKTEMILQIT